MFRQVIFVQVDSDYGGLYSKFMTRKSINEKGNATEEGVLTTL